MQSKSTRKMKSSELLRDNSKTIARKWTYKLKTTRRRKKRLLPLLVRKKMISLKQSIPAIRLKKNSLRLIMKTLRPVRKLSNNSKLIKKSATLK